MEEGLSIVLTTLPPKNAEILAEEVVKQKLAVCVLNLEVDSVFPWKGRIEKEKERLLIIKTPTQVLEKLLEYLRAEHPYEVPFIFVLRGLVNEEYLEWAKRELEKPEK